MIYFWGAGEMGASNRLLRLTPVDYADDISQMKTGTDPMTVARIVFDQSNDMPNSLGISDLFVSWGQFVDHDLSLTPDASGELVHVPGMVAPLERSVFDPSTGTTQAREHINVVAPAMDASQLYGSDSVREAELRLFSGGLLNMPGPGLLPMTEAGMAGASVGNPLFLSGDVRANENTGLTVLHTLFSREHNYWADKLSKLHPDWTDEQLFQAARSIVEYEMQKITYDDWLPHLIGDATGPDSGFDSTQSGQISTEFSTAAYRFGHTMISSSISQVEEDGAQSAQGDILVRDAFFNIDQIKTHGIEDLLRGLSESKAQELDTQVIDDLNFFLALPTGVTGFSLPALNILRGRDHGLGNYIDVRADLIGDVDPNTIDVTDFSIITSDQSVQAKLAQVYGTVDQVDLWVGGLAEDAVGSTLMGQLFTFIIADQFARTRAADASFGDLDPNLDASILAELRDVSLGDIITRNTDVTHIQEDVFVSADRLGGDARSEVLIGQSGNDLLMGFGGDDVIKGREGDDALYGGDGNDKLVGNKGEDVLFGGAGDDTLLGNRDDDRLDGGAGDDMLRGGFGRDTFVFSAGYGRDVIKDFAEGYDLIELSGFGATGFHDLASVASHRSGNLHLTFGSDKLIVKDTYLWELSSDDFSFA